MKQYLQDNLLIQQAATSKAICWAKYVVMSVKDLRISNFLFYIYVILPTFGEVSLIS